MTSSKPFASRPMRSFDQAPLAAGAHVLLVFAALVFAATAVWCIAAWGAFRQSLAASRALAWLATMLWIALVAALVWLPTRL